MTFDRQSRVALIVTSVLLAVFAVGFRSAVGYLNIYLTKLPVPLRERLSDLPRRLGKWEAQDQDQILSKEMVEELGTEWYVDRVYRRPGTDGPQILAVHVAYYTGMIDPIPHIPERCMVAAGFDQVSLPRALDLHVDRSLWKVDPDHTCAGGEPCFIYPLKHYISGKPVPLFDASPPLYGVRMPGGDLAIRTMEFQEKRSDPRRIIAGYFFIANGRVSSTAEGVRLLAFDMRQKHAYYCKVQFTMPAQHEQEGTQEFADRVADLLNSMLPELMRCLPDWVQVEAGDAQPSDGHTERPNTEVSHGN